ncbi:hypothetical protein EYF80_034781 [Liparis tanakae]|uniref:Uncharacterized protein n=1 Tax=Liparis tanakae TaxID=230148 RepID=A0A4Z2GQJ7_9TELE|nr:hypothetical protein EYF80_034781 [Liparis tanakae]
MSEGSGVSRVGWIMDSRLGRRGRYLREANVRRVNSPAAVSKQAAVERQPYAAELVLGPLERILREKAVDAPWRRTGRRNGVKRVHENYASAGDFTSQYGGSPKAETKQKDDPRSPNTTESLSD